MLALPKESRLRHGATGPDGRVFWGYNTRCKNGELWVSRKKFCEMRERRKREARENRARSLDKRREHSRRYSKEHKEEFACKMRRLREQNPEECRRKAQEWRDKSQQRIADTSFAYRLRYFYSLTVEDYRELESRQGGKCSICGAHQDDLEQCLCVDHCHKTGRVRGLLCVKCNAGVGMFSDNPKILAAAIRYLKGDKL